MTGKQPPIKIEMAEGTSNLTPNASVIAIDKFFAQSGLSEVIDAAIGARNGRGASDSDQIKALVIGRTCGSKAIEHQKFLTGRVDALGIAVPSVTANRTYLEIFHNGDEDEKRGMGQSYIPEENRYLSGFKRIHGFLFKIAHGLSPLKEITLDQDATLIPTTRPEACFNYKKERSYEAFNTYCPEYDIMVSTRYSDGNVTAGFQQLEELKGALSLVPYGVEKVSLRSDTAGYQTELMQYCAEGREERFGVIDFGISCPVGKEFKEAVKQVPEGEWRPLRREGEEGESVQEWAEVSYAPTGLCKSKKSAEIRFYAIREEFTCERRKLKPSVPEQQEIQYEMTQELLDELSQSNENMKSLHLTEMSGTAYKVFGVASNILDKPGDEIILWSRKRCGKSEQAHDVLKNELAGSHVPSHLFGVNAAWWNIGVLAMNVNNVIKRNFLPREYAEARMEKLRYAFYTLVGKMLRHARQRVLRIWSGDKASELLMYAIERLDRLLPAKT